MHGKPVQLNIDKLWSHNITLTTRLVDTVTTPMLLKTVMSGKVQPNSLQRLSFQGKGHIPSKLLRGLFRFTHPHDHVVFNQILIKRDVATGYTLPIQLHPDYAMLTPVRILHLNRVDRFTVTEAEAETGP